MNRIFFEKLECRDFREESALILKGFFESEGIELI